MPTQKEFAKKSIILMNWGRLEFDDGYLDFDQVLRNWLNELF